MGLVVFPRTGFQLSDKGEASWTELPLLCCQDAGGAPASAVPVAAAWGLIYTAAHLMDAVEDQDELEELGPEASPARVVNLATGLYASSTQLLTRLPDTNVESGLGLEIIRDFHQTILLMSGTQHRDLIGAKPSLHDWWEMAEGKSGSFFALGCRTGARLATSEPGRIQGYSRYGHNLGVLIQIADDAKDFWGLDPAQAFDPRKIERSLPVLYTSSVVSPQEEASLTAEIRAASESPRSRDAVHRQVERAGAPLYLAAKIEQHYREAVQALGEPVLSPPARHRLLELVEWTRSPGAA